VIDDQISAVEAVPPPFHEVVVNPTRAGGLAHLSGNSCSIGTEFLAGLQLRDSAGLSPASPLILPIRGVRHPWLMDIRLCFDCKRGLVLRQGDLSPFKTEKFYHPFLGYFLAKVYDNVLTCKDGATKITPAGVTKVRFFLTNEVLVLLAHCWR
jgi:hypothetical protein